MRDLITEQRLNIVLALILLGGPLIAHFADEPFLVTLATRATILALAGVGLNIALGLGGLVSFGHAAFFGLGGYAVGILASHHQTYQPLMTWPFVINGTNQMLILWLVAVLVSGLAALVIGTLSLRTSGVYFIMITLAFAQMIYYFAISWPAYGGEDGLSIYVRSVFPGINTLKPLHFFLLCYGVLIAVLLAQWRMTGARFGIALQAVRQNQGRVAALGLSPYRIKLAAFVISGMVTGLAGALYADLNRFVSPSMMSWHLSGEIMVFIILGGVARLFGPVVGACLFVLFEHVFGSFTTHWQFFLGAALLGVVLFARGGFIGLVAGRARHE
ncbi:MAG: branched-chain amino acid ABC transporter permease [Hoeflea sp.]|uniref:branched-chain amino acid ABC transporter permease n=1 Tax=Hoeflea sp. TaxID=1940281 RepID=UPI001DD70FBB|nr:branched-chain amino acid ABC transporter permease [Hoeflea sp.]MBU4528904.1 branched-chain amino acid ABC transporter permease [Alphaproteobacteria bacterium]MBU4544037.1 branched-chain amino acid ABC transporter permease [Alphaproteobacteria bacterium]MBU4551906.1 branched-chain amino acid ABC transporter permease [Alphaproteobacteria bacterium]MBV1723371.1 branched-chain amino acid ABC transporter permease [Hoeflea sp.]MBV1760350.1 branched-chain amino acid ABC transporter permease [Hoef